MSYTMTMRFSGLMDVTVEANSEAEAIEKAKAVAYDSDWNAMFAPEAEVFLINGEGSMANA